MKKIILVIAIILSFQTESKAGFAHAGTTITQSLVDDDLTNLGSLTGVVTTVTAGAGGRIFTTYDIGNNKLLINGTLTIDASKEMIIVGATAPRSIIDVVGILNIEDTETINGVVGRKQRTAIRTTYSRSHCCSDLSVRIRSGATLTMRGGGIECGSSIAFDAGSTVDIEDGRIEQLNAPASEYQIRQFSAAFSATKLRLVKYTMTMVGVPLVFDEYSPLHCFEGVGFSGSSANSIYEFRDYAGGGSGNTMDFALWAAKKGKVINSASGSDLIVFNHIATNTTSRGTIEVYKEMTSKVIDESGADVEGAIIYSKDYNNGNRTDGNGYTFSTDRVYTETTDATGAIPTTEFLTGVVNEPVLDATPDWDYRSKNGDATDIFDIYIWSYLHNGAELTNALKGAGVGSIDWTLFNDRNITETDRTVVDAYTEIENLDQAYDRAKSWKVTTANVDFPEPNLALGTGDGSSIDWDSLNVIVDATATNAFEVNETTNTVTIKSDTLVLGDRFRSLITGGEISAANGAQLQFGYVDSTGTYKYVEINNIDSSAVYIIDVTNGDTLLSADTITGTFSGVFKMPLGSPIIETRVIRENYLDWVDEFPDADLVMVRNVFTAPICKLDKQDEMINLTLKLLQKNEAILNALCDEDNPTLNVTTTTSANPNDASEANQEEILRLLRLSLMKTTAIREAQK